jgi:integrase
MKNGTVSVRRTLTRSSGRYTLGEPKTKKSRRSIRLTPRAVEALESHLEVPRPEAHLRNAAVDPGDTPQVRPGSTGTRHNSDNPGHLLPRHARHGRSDRARYAGRALLKAAALVSGWCQKGPGVLLSLIFTSVFYLQIKGFFGWACLDSNQGPLPYQRSALTG